MLVKLFKSAPKYVLPNIRGPPLYSCQAQDFPGIYTCSIDDRLDTIFDTIRKSRVHRFVVIDEQTRLVGVLTLSDILEYVLLEGEKDDSRPE